MGKSTFCRSLVNSLLLRFPQVAYLDIDVGQGEYSPAGLLTLSLIAEPQLRSSSVPCVERESVR